MLRRLCCMTAVRTPRARQATGAAATRVWLESCHRFVSSVCHIAKDEALGKRKASRLNTSSAPLLPAVLCLHDANTQRSTTGKSYRLTQHRVLLQAAVSSGLGENTFEVRRISPDQCSLPMAD